MANQDRMIFQTDETRSLILDAAWKIFLEKGFFDAQMKDVASATGLSRTSLYRYFQDKTDLAMALIERATLSQGDYRRGIGEADGEERTLPGLEALGLYIKRRWLSSELRDFYVFLAEFDAYFSGSRVPPNFNEGIRKAMHADCDEVLLSLLERGVEDGSVRPDLDLHLAMVTIVNAVRGMQQRLLLRGNTLVEVLPGELELMPETLVDFLMKGIRNEAGGRL